MIGIDRAGRFLWLWVLLGFCVLLVLPINLRLIMKTNILTLLILLGSLTGCAQRKELRKARKQARYERKAEYFRVKAGLPECTDTVAIDTVIVPKSVHDTTFKAVHDTTHYETDRVVIKHFYNHTDSTVFIQAECKEAKVIHTIETIKETKTVEIYPAWITSTVVVFKYWWVLLVAFALASGVIITLRLTKKIGL